MWLLVAPVVVVPSPQLQEYDVMLPSGSVEPPPSTEQVNSAQDPVNPAVGA